MPVSPYELGYKIRSWRLDSGFSIERFAKLINYSPKAIQQWENGKALPSFDAIIVLSKTMGVSSDWLLGQSNIWQTADAILQMVSAKQL